MDRSPIKMIVIWLLAVAVAMPMLYACKEITPPKKGDDTVLDNVINGLPSDNEPKNVIYAVLSTLSAIENYKYKSTGKTVTNVLFGATYTQNTESQFARDGKEYYFATSSNSTFVKISHKVLYMGGDSVAQKREDKDASLMTATDYRGQYGFTPDKALSGHIYNDETILSVELTGEEEGKYTYKIVLDKDKGNALLSYQMKEYGGLKDYPQFTDNTNITLVIDCNYRPVSLYYESFYKVSIAVLGNKDCKEDNFVEFYDYDVDGEIGGVENLRELLQKG